MYPTVSFHCINKFPTRRDADPQKIPVSTPPKAQFSTTHMGIARDTRAEGAVDLVFDGANIDVKTP
jgi:hypothetical protein